MHGRKPERLLTNGDRLSLKFIGFADDMVGGTAFSWELGVALALTGGGTIAVGP